MKEYDIVIIGTGAGLAILEVALQKGMTCAIIEKSKFGGTCLTRGCIPSKVLVHPADVIREAEHARKTGLTFNLEKVDWQILSKRMWSQIDECKVIEENVDEAPGLDTYKGIGEFTGPYTMKVMLKDGSFSEEFKGQRFVIAAGGRTYIPSIKGLQETGFLDSESFFGEGFPSKPWASLVIIGGGAIGTEFAHIFSAFGTKVTIIDKNPRLVKKEEEEISELLAAQFRAVGIDVLLNSRVTKASREGDVKTVTVQDILTGETTSIDCDEIFVSSGIRSNADLLKVENSGIHTDAKGWIITNEYLQTSQKNIWAFGDINGKYQFRHKANYEAEICAYNIFGQEQSRRAADYTKVPWAIFTYPQIAHVGLTEEEIKKRGIRYLVGKKYYSSVARGFAMGYIEGDADDGFVKLLADENMKILGAHIVGPQASVLIQPLVYLMNTGFTCKIESKKGFFGKAKEICTEGGTFVPMNQSMVIHPSLSEVVGWVTNTMTWAEVPSIDSDYPKL